MSDTSHRTPLLSRGRGAPARLRGASSTPSPGAAPSGCARCSSSEEWVAALGALTGGQAVQMVKAGLEGDLPLRLAGRRRRQPRRADLPRPEPLPGQQRAGAGHRINNALLRADQIAHAEGDDSTDWLAPIVADAEAGFGGPLNAFELMKAFIEAGAAGVHFEDQLASEKKCGHLGGKVLVPTLAVHPHADRGAPGGGRARRADAAGRAHRRARATLLTSDVDERDRAFLTGERTRRGLLPRHDGIDAAVARGLAYAPYADLLWFETSTPDIEEAETFAEAIHARLPGQAARLQLLAVVQLEAPPHRRARSPASSAISRGWATASSSSRWPVSTRSTTRCSSSRAATRERAMSAYVELQEREFAAEQRRLHGDAPPARGRRRLLRPVLAGDQRRRCLDARLARLDRGGAVRARGGPAHDRSRARSRPRRAVDPERRRRSRC